MCMTAFLDGTFGKAAEGRPLGAAGRKLNGTANALPNSVSITHSAGHRDTGVTVKMRKGVGTFYAN